MSFLVNPYLYAPSCTDADALAFLSAAAITDATITSAICTLVTTMKADGTWAKCNAIYPMVGGTATTHKFNLKNPTDTNAAFRLSFVGGWTHSSNGALPNGTNAYADTFFTPSVDLSVTNGHVSLYSIIQSLLTTNIDIGSATGTGLANIVALVTGRSINLSSFYWGSQVAGTSATFSSTSSRGFFIGNQNGATAATRNIYRNGIVGTPATVYGTPVMPNRTLYLGALNSVVVNGPAYYSSRQFAFASIGSGLTTGEAVAFYNAVQAFQTTLSRQV
jgi:hypothetical protein